MAAVPLEPNELLVCFVRTRAFGLPGMAAAARRLLEPEECKALERLRPPSAARDYLAAHALLRIRLADAIGVDPADLHLHVAEGGKPVLDAPAWAHGLHFSLSHARGMALCALARDCEIGADVESLRQLVADPTAVAEAVCSEDERAALARLPMHARALRLAGLWTMKAAIAKAGGEGPAVVPEAEHGPWCYAARALPPGHWATVVVPCDQAPALAVRFEECVPETVPEPHHAKQELHLRIASRVIERVGLRVSDGVHAPA